jgi:hypothetical protein
MTYMDFTESSDDGYEGENNVDSTMPHQIKSTILPKVLNAKCTSQKKVASAGFRGALWYDTLWCCLCRGVRVVTPQTEFLH